MLFFYVFGGLGGGGIYIGGWVYVKRFECLMNIFATFWKKDRSDEVAGEVP